MGAKSQQVPRRQVLSICRRQQGIIRGEQLLELGITYKAIRHRVSRGRLYRLYRDVYSLVPPEDLSRKGHWRAAVYACGPEAVLSDESAGCLLGIHHRESTGIEITVPPTVSRSHPGLTIHRKSLTRNDVTRRNGIAVTNVGATLVALTARLKPPELERAISEADRLKLIDPERLRAYLDKIGQRKGVATLRATLDRHTFTLTDSELERRFIPIALKAGLPMPLTRQFVNGYRVDFHFPILGLVVETDGQTYHRTPQQQTTDRLRDQAHTAAGLTQLRFTHWQVRREPTYVETTLAKVARRLSAV